MSSADRTLPRRLIVLLTALLFAAAWVIMTAAPASAHDRLLGSDPTADSTIEQLPDTLSLTFSAAITADAGASEVQVVDAAGVSLADGDPTIDGALLTQPLAPVTAAGAVTVLWKVVSSDGHPISGEFTFTVSEAPPAPSPTATQTPTQTPSATASPAPSSASPTPSASEAATPSDSTAVVPWVIAVVLGALVIAATAYLIASRSRRRKASSRQSPAESEHPADR